MQLYADENFSQPVVVHLRSLGHDVLTARDVGKSQQGIPDPEVLQYAKDLDRVLITFNAWDFVKLHEILPDHAGIIVCSVDRDTDALAQRIDDALVSTGNVRGKLVRITRPSAPP